MPARALALALAMAACTAFTASAQEGATEEGEWNFTATLDGKPIGTHRFAVGGSAAARSVDSRADFVVRMLGVPVYRYRHHAGERWAGDCLRELRADTDDDGTRQQVARRFEDDCVMTFAYGTPACRSSSAWSIRRPASWSRCASSRCPTPTSRSAASPCGRGAGACRPHSSASASGMPPTAGAGSGWTPRPRATGS